MLSDGSNIEPIQLNSHLTDLLGELVDIQVLSSILGYSDVRSTRDWCGRVDVPLFTLGKRTYTFCHYLEDHIRKIIDDQPIEEELSGAPRKDSRVDSKELSEASKKFLGDE